MTKIMILEDSIDSIKALTAIVEKVSEEVTVVPARSLEEARIVLKNTENLFRAFLLDINLDRKNDADISGIELAREIRGMRQYEFTPIIMVTSVATLELQVYRELHCYQYILKPYVREDIVRIVKKVLFHAGGASEPYILVKKEGINYKIFCKDIIYVRAIPRGVCLVLRKEEINVPYLSIRQLMEKLPGEQFVQCHRMYVVNRNDIEYIDIVNRMINLKEGAGALEIGVTYRNEIRRQMNG